MHRDSHAELARGSADSQYDGRLIPCCGIGGDARFDLHDARKDPGRPACRNNFGVHAADGQRDRQHRFRRRDYIYLSGWEATPFTPLYERLSRDPSWHVHSLPTGHNVMVEAPDALLEIVLATALILRP